MSEGNIGDCRQVLSPPTEGRGYGAGLCPDVFGHKLAVLAQPEPVNDDVVSRAVGLEPKRGLTVQGRSCCYWLRYYYWTGL